MWGPPLTAHRYCIYLQKRKSAATATRKRVYISYNPSYRSCHHQFTDLCPVSTQSREAAYKMANRIPVVLLLVLPYGLLIEGHFSVPKIKGIEPEVIEIPSGELPHSLVRNKRQQFGNVSHIGVTARLTNDSHNVAIVHWSGYPSEVS